MLSLQSRAEKTEAPPLPSFPVSSVMSHHEHLSGLLSRGPLTRTLLSCDQGSVSSLLGKSGASSFTQRTWNAVANVFPRWHNLKFFWYNQKYLRHAETGVSVDGFVLSIPFGKLIQNGKTRAPNARNIFTCEKTQCLLKNCSMLTCQSFIKALVVPAEKDIWSWRRVANCCPVCKVSLQCDQPSVSLGGVVVLKLWVLNCQHLKKSRDFYIKIPVFFFSCFNLKMGRSDHQLAFCHGDNWLQLGNSCLLHRAHVLTCHGPHRALMWSWC